MLCSKCKIFSIHLKNYDSFICEYGHVICRTCSQQNLDPNKCSLCDGKIVRLTEFHLEGHPKTIFKAHNENDEVKSGSVAKSNKIKDEHSLISLYGSEEDQHNLNAGDIASSKAERENLSLLSHRLNNQTSNFSSKPIKTAAISALLDGKYNFHSFVDVDTDEDLSDSSTVIQHLSEFRRATNYTPPSILSAYKVQDMDPHHTPAIITTSKTCLSCRTKSTILSKNSTKSKAAQTISGIRKDASTAIEIGLSIKYEPSIKCQNRLTEEISKMKEMSPNKFCSEFSANLREKLKSEIYAPFDSDKPAPKNTFMVKSELGDIPPKIILFDATATDKENCLTETINAEIDKALKNITVCPNILVRGRVRRDKILRQSKSFLRQKVLEEVYSPFLRHTTSTPQPSVFDQDIQELNNNLHDDLIDEKVHVEVEKEEEDKILAQSVDSTSDLERTVAISTESYPKLGVNISVVTTSNNIASHSFSEDAYIQEPSIFDPNESERNISKTNGILSKKSPSASGDTCSQIHQPISNEKFLKKQTLIKPIPVLPTSDHVLPPRKKTEDSTVTANEPLFDIPEMSSELEMANEILKPGGNTVYFCQTAADFNSPQDACLEQQSTQMDRTTFNQVGDCLQTSENRGMEGRGTDLLRFIQKHFPNLRLKDLKNIIMGIPINEHEYEKDSESNKFSLTNDPKTELGFLNPQSKSDVNSQPCPLSKCQASHDIISHLKSDANNELGFLNPQNKNDINSQPCPLSKSQASYDIIRQVNIIASRACFPHICTAFGISPQYQILPPIDDHVLSQKSCKEVPRAVDFNVPRSPIVCPVTACSKLVFITELSKHMKIDHARIPVECISPGEHKNVFLDSRLGSYGVSKCHVLFMVTNKIKDLGHNEFKDYLPILLMSRRVRLSDILCLETKAQKHLVKNDNCLMIWLTGITFPSLPIYYTLVAWSRKSNLPRCHIAHSGEIYSMRNSQDIRSLFKSGQCLLLKYEHWMLLTNDGKDMMELQLVIH